MNFLRRKLVSRSALLRGKRRRGPQFAPKAPKNPQKQTTTSNVRKDRHIVPHAVFTVPSAQLPPRLHAKVNKAASDKSSVTSEAGMRLVDIFETGWYGDLGSLDPVKMLRFELEAFKKDETETLKRMDELVLGTTDDEKDAVAYEVSAAMASKVFLDSIGSQLAKIWYDPKSVKQDPTRLDRENAMYKLCMQSGFSRFGAVRSVTCLLLGFEQRQHSLDLESLILNDTFKQFEKSVTGVLRKDHAMVNENAHYTMGDHLWALIHNDMVRDGYDVSGMEFSWRFFTLVKSPYSLLKYRMFGPHTIQRIDLHWRLSDKKGTQVDIVTPVIASVQAPNLQLPFKAPPVKRLTVQPITPDNYDGLQYLYKLLPEAELQEMKELGRYSCMVNFDRSVLYDRVS